MDENEIERLAQSRIGEPGNEVENKIRQLEQELESKFTDIKAKADEEVVAIRSRQLATIRDFGERTENETIAIVYCANCGYVAGVSPSPASARSVDFNRQMEAAVAAIKEGNTVTLAELRRFISSVDESSRLAAEQRLASAELLDHIASILSSPQTSFSVDLG